jgi:hypothetical protein
MSSANRAASTAANATLSSQHPFRSCGAIGEVFAWEVDMAGSFLGCSFDEVDQRQGKLSARHGFGIFSDLCTLLALREGRLRAASCLIGFADEAWERIGRPPGASVRLRVKAIASLKADMDRVTLEGLIN